MTQTVPQSDLLQKAVKWIDDERRDHPQKPLDGILDEAGMRFNLSPLDSQFLRTIFSKKEKND